MQMATTSPKLYMNLRYWRRAKALTIKDLAELASVATATICKIENNPGRLPRTGVIKRLVQALNIPVESLVIRGEIEKEAFDEKTPPRKRLLSA